MTMPHTASGWVLPSQFDVKTQVSLNLSVTNTECLMDLTAEIDEIAMSVNEKTMK